MSVSEIINSERNYIYPFFWPDEDHPENIPAEVDAVCRSGCGGLCLEARPFEKFGEDEWWHTAKTVLEEAKKRSMKVWILDDKHFPTGYANGGIEKKYPDLARHWLYEHHFDVYGPRKDMTVRLPERDGHMKMYVFAYKRTGVGEELTGEAVPIEIKGESEFVMFDVPEGLWRVFTVVDTSFINRHGHQWHIDMLSKESAAVLIENVYEEHYSHLSEYFGNTLEGFFSDEPSFNAEHTERWGRDAGFYYRTVGQPGVSLPWNDTVAGKMTEAGIENVMAKLPALWYDHKQYSSEIRFGYMDAVTRLWNENFSYAVGNWCRSKGVLYTGHIIEDMNAHSRLGSSSGHYFRGLSGQDISGIDIVLHQVLPGMSDYTTAAAISEGVADGTFFHYTLGHLASSLARIEPHMHDRAMCELFGAYGWAETLPCMKWLSDFLMIRGINRFVPHAFSVKYPFDDCPPHFYANGCNPQYDGFSVLMPYINRVSRLLDGKVRRTDGAIFYYAENEWLNTKAFRYCDMPAKNLYDDHIDYDILPLDALEKAEISDGKLVVNGKEHKFLVIPEAEKYPVKLISLADGFMKKGLPVFTAVDEEKRFGNVIGTCVPDSVLAAKVREAADVTDYGIGASKMRIAEFDGENTKVFFIFNEAPCKKLSAEVTLPVTGAYSELHILNDGYYGGHTDDGKISVELEEGESVIFVFDGEKSGYPEKTAYTETVPLDITWDISVSETGTDGGYRPYRVTDKLFNVNAPDEMPSFSGNVRYRGKFVFDGTSAEIDLGNVGCTAQLIINGRSLPVRIGRPYSWDASDFLVKGENEIEVITANTLSNRIEDDLSTFMPLEAAGMQGPVRIRTTV